MDSLHSILTDRELTKLRILFVGALGEREREYLRGHCYLKEGRLQIRDSCAITQERDNISFGKYFVRVGLTKEGELIYSTRDLIGFTFSYPVKFKEVSMSSCGRIFLLSYNFQVHEYVKLVANGHIMMLRSSSEIIFLNSQGIGVTSDYQLVDFTGTYLLTQTISPSFSDFYVHPDSSITVLEKENPNCAVLVEGKLYSADDIIPLI